MQPLQHHSYTANEYQGVSSKCMHQRLCEHKGDICRLIACPWNHYKTWQDLTFQSVACEDWWAMGATCKVTVDFSQILGT